MIRSSSCAAMALFTLATPLALCRPGDAVAQAMPAETFFYASVDVGAAQRGLANLDLAKLLHDAEVAAFLKPVLDSMHGIDPADPVGSALKQLPTDEWIRGRATIGISGLEFAIGGPEKETMRLSAEHPLSAMLLHRMISISDLDEGGESNETAANETAAHGAHATDMWFLLDGILSLEPGPSLKQLVSDWLAAPPPELRVAHANLQGHDVTVIDVDFPDHKHTRLYADLSGDRWTIGGVKRSFEAALTGSGSQGAKGSLADSPTYKSFRSRVTAGDTAAFMMLDVKGALSSFRSLIPPIALEEAQILGIDTLRGIATGISFVEGGVRESLLIGFDGPPHGVLAPLKALGGGFKSLDAAPGNTAFFAGLHFDIEKLVAIAREETKTLAPTESDLVDKEMKKLNVGEFNLLNDIVPTFGGEVSIALGVPKVGFIPDAVFILELRDAKRFQKLLDFAKSQVAEQGVLIRPLSIPDGANSIEGFSVAMQGAPVQPAFAVLNDRLVGAISGPALKAYIAKGARQEKTLKDDAGFAAVRRGLAGCAPESAAIWIHLDLQKTIPIAYETGSAAIPALLQESGLPLDAAQLPTGETIAQYLKSVAIAIHCDDEGLSLDAFSPTGILGLGVAANLIERHEHAGPKPAARAGVKDMKHKKPAKKADEDDDDDDDEDEDEDDDGDH